MNRASRRILGCRPGDGMRAKRSLLGTIRRRDGRLQATYARRPRYCCTGDKKPGQDVLQNVSVAGGLWLVV